MSVIPLSYLTELVVGQKVNWNFVRFFFNNKAGEMPATDINL